MGNVFLTRLFIRWFSEKPGQPVVQINPSELKARSALVTWSYNPGADEVPVTAYNLEYRNSTFAENISLGAVLSKRIINLKPYTTYSVRLIPNSVLGKSPWSNVQNFKTKTASKWWCKLDAVLRMIIYIIRYFSKILTTTSFYIDYCCYHLIDIFIKIWRTVTHKGM